MRLIASWTRFHPLLSDQWAHHWIIRATCRQEALQFVEDNLKCSLNHAPPMARGWKHRGYEITQAGWGA